MIRFSLGCEKDHEFEGWFGSSDDFEKQLKRGLIACPTCQSVKISKRLMAPAVSTSKVREQINVASVDHARKEVLAQMRELRDKITSNGEDVGEKFPEEARKIHYGETEKRTVYGSASRDEVVDLLEEGVEIAPLPVLPDDTN